jgi:succinoglycan biosynthesis protein ExoA
VSNALPVFSIVIAARPDQANVQAVDATRALDYPADRIEVIVARGRQPSVQRNAAIRAAKGDLIYFLDDDSLPEPDNLRRAAEHFRDPQVQMAGGPNLCPAEAPTLEQLFALTMGARLAFGPSAARYRAIGKLRASSEKELILCNLVARRQALLDAGGFDESLYPNEENALMDDLQSKGGKLLYDPELAVRRRPRSNVRAFVKMLMNYGRGRAEQFRLHPTLGSALNFVPPLFVVYLLASPFLPATLLLPWLIYFVAVLAQAWQVTGRKPLHWALGIAPLILMTHIFYGIGFWRGLFTRLKPPSAQISGEVKLSIAPPPS